MGGVLAWPELIWQPLDSTDAMARLEREFLRWEGTPYKENCQRPGAGVDCVRFVCAIADAMTCRDPLDIPSIPSDKSLHDQAGAHAALRFLMRRYNAKMIDHEGIEPGDVLVTGPKDGGPGHAILVGNRPNQMWQSTRPHVHYTGVGPQTGAEVFYGTLRVPKEDW